MPRPSPLPEPFAFADASESRSIRVLIADDEEIIRDVYEQVLAPEETPELPDHHRVTYDIVFCEQAKDAVDEVRAAVAEGKPFALAFLDIRMPPGHDGVWAAERIRKLDPYLEIAIVTAYSDVNPLDIAVRVPPADQLLYLQKPFHPHEILQVASALASKWLAHRRLLWNRVRLATVQRIARVGDWECDPETGHASWSAELGHILGLPQDRLQGPAKLLWETVYLQDAKRVKQAINNTLQEGVEESVEYRISDANGELRHVRLEVVRITSPSGQALRLVGSIQDITERKRYEQRIRYLAYHDPLTGLSNRAFLRRYLPFTLKTAERHKSLVAVIFLDLDGFKRVNDTLGHDAGDGLLKEAAGRIRDCVRESDCLARPSELEDAQSETVTRLAGDEFIVILNDVGSIADATVVAQRIVESLREPIRQNDELVICPASVGVAMYPRDGEDADTLLKCADVAMYQAKKNGRDRYEVYSDEMVESGREMVLAGG